LTTFDQLTEPERLLLGVLSQLAPEPIPLGLFDTKALMFASRFRGIFVNLLFKMGLGGPWRAVSFAWRTLTKSKSKTGRLAGPREHLAALAGYSLVRFEDSGDSVRVHRLVQEIGRRRVVGSGSKATLRIALEAVNELAPRPPDDVRNWAVWAPLAPHAKAVADRSDAAGLMQPTARLMSLLGLYLRARGDYREAERIYLRSLAIIERLHASDHPQVAIHLSGLALLLQDTNRLREAEPLLRRALAIDERWYGPYHPEVAICLNNLALLLQAMNRLREAEPLISQALAIGERSYGPYHP
jgi:tetratricopeptide (TPR) repeat protein